MVWARGESEHAARKGECKGERRHCHYVNEVVVVGDMFVCVPSRRVRSPQSLLWLFSEFLPKEEAGVKSATSVPRTHPSTTHTHHAHSRIDTYPHNRCTHAPTHNLPTPLDRVPVVFQLQLSQPLAIQGLDTPG